MLRRTRSEQSRSASRRRASNFRKVLHDLQQQVARGPHHGEGLRQRFDDFRNRRNNNNTNRTNQLLNLDEYGIQEEVHHWAANEQDRARQLEIDRSEQSAIQRRHSLTHVPRIGNICQQKGDDTFRWMYCQVNGMATNHAKLQDILHLAETFDADGIVLVEVGVNWKFYRPSSRLSSRCNKLSAREIRATEAYNTHAPISSPAQQGGTAIITRHSILEFAKNISHDPKDLGRWASWVISATPDHISRVVVAYCPGRTKKTGPGTVYCQHLTAINSLGLDCTPYQMFVSDLTNQLRCWRAAGERLCLFIDANEHIRSGNIARVLAEKHIDMHEASHRFWGVSGEHNTYILGSKPIDGIFATPDLDITGFLSLSFHEGVGDHRTTFTDISTPSMIGIYQPHIVRPTSRRLTTRNASSVRNYNSELWDRLRRHRIPERWNTLATAVASSGYQASPLHRDQAEQLHVETLEHRLGAEHNCRKILKPASAFSLPIKFWYDRIHAYQGLIRLLQGEHPKMGRSRIYRFARNHDIENPQKLSIEDCQCGIASAKRRQKEIRKQEDAHRRQHLGNCLQAAMDAEDKEKIVEIKERMRNEQSRKTWLRIKKVTQSARGKSVTQVEVQIHGQTILHRDRDGVELAIQQECSERFLLGHCAPISNTPLGQELRYMQDPDIANQILLGTYHIPPDLDPATSLLLVEMGRMGRLTRQNPDADICEITTQQYQHYFCRIKENTASSPSGLHHGHDKSSAQHEQLSEFFAFQMTTIMRSGLQPTRWGMALQVLLEKIAGVCLVTKLRSIQLYDSHFNWFNKIIFNDAAMLKLTQSGCLPEELYSQHGRTAEDACFDKTITLDISRQSRQPLSLISVDAAQCYDRVNHTMMALVWLALKVPFLAVSMILQGLGYMKIFTRTGYGDSRRYFGGEDMELPFCGLGQGSKSAPASWVQLSSVIVNCYKQRGFGAKIRDPISGDICTSIGCSFVDDTDLYNMEDGRLDEIAELQEESQQALNWWSALLAATGGAIKDAKSFWYLLSYRCSGGMWEYENNQRNINLQSLDNNVVALTNYTHTHAVKTLGVLTEPCGGHATQLISIRDKTNSWMQNMKNGHLPASHVWLSYLHQLRPGILYGLGTLSNDMESACRCLSDTEYQLLPLLGVNRNIKRGWRTLHQTFGGIGLMDLPVEQFICRINLLQQHYGTPSGLGHKLSASIHWLQLQLGTAGSPFNLPYVKHSNLAPISWTKCLWELLDKYDVGLHLEYDSLPIQRDGDMEVMVFLDRFLSNSCLRASVNRCRCYLNVMFLSDVVTLDGRGIHNDLVVGSRSPLRSKMRFPPEHPTQNDWSVWVTTWFTATTENLQLLKPLGAWVTVPHFVWPWIYDATSNSLYVLREKGFLLHKESQLSTHITRNSTKFVQTSETTQSALGDYVSVTAIPTSNGMVYHSPKQGVAWADPVTTATEFWQYVIQWGGTWMWEMIYPDMQDGFEAGWLISSLRNGTLMGVTDGSYNKSKDPRVCGAGWILMDIPSGQRLAGSFSESSNSAGSYRGELLGLYAINIILLALTKAGSITNTPEITIWCDNQGAISKASGEQRRIRSGMSCSDILRSLKSVGIELPLLTTYRHVKAHMDDTLTWDQMNLETQLNCQCDALAKSAVARAIEHNLESPRTASGTLPRERSAIFIGNEKITSDPTNALRYLISKFRAKHFLVSHHGWSEAQFDSVGWDWLDKVLAKKPVMYRIWLSKQHSNFCATARNMKRAGYSDDDRCPSCWKRKERANHLCRCPSQVRTQLFLDNVNKLEQWLSADDKTCPELAYWTIKFILGRGALTFAELGAMSMEVQEVAASQDMIGWRNLMEGRVSIRFYSVQQRHLLSTGSRLNGDEWMQGFINRLLNISHSQWLLRNFTLHDKQYGFKRTKDRAEVLLRIEELMHTNPSRIPEHSRFLLEIDPTHSASSSFDTQSYWVAAMEAARGAQANALWGNIARPPTSTFGVFQVQETIRIETRDRHHAPRVTAPADRSAHISTYPVREAGGLRGLTESDRRRKPD